MRKHWAEKYPPQIREPRCVIDEYSQSFYLDDHVNVAQVHSWYLRSVGNTCPRVRMRYGDDVWILDSEDARLSEENTQRLVTALKRVGTPVERMR